MSLSAPSNPQKQVVAQSKQEVWEATHEIHRGSIAQALENLKAHLDLAFPQLKLWITHDSPGSPGNDTTGTIPVRPYLEASVTVQQAESRRVIIFSHPDGMEALAAFVGYEGGLSENHRIPNAVCNWLRDARTGVLDAEKAEAEQGVSKTPSGLRRQQGRIALEVKQEEPDLRDPESGALKEEHQWGVQQAQRDFMAYRASGKTRDEALAEMHLTYLHLKGEFEEEISAPHQDRKEAYFKGYQNALVTFHATPLTPVEKAERIANLEQPSYNTKLKVAKRNGGPRTARDYAVLSDTEAAAKAIRAHGPDWSKADHVCLAAAHELLANHHEAEWSRVANEAAQAAFGRPFQLLLDYKISGVGREEFGEEHKNQLRNHAHSKSDHRALAHVHTYITKHYRDFPEKSGLPVDENGAPK